MDVKGFSKDFLIVADLSYNGKLKIRNVENKLQSTNDILRRMCYIFYLQKKFRFYIPTNLCYSVTYRLLVFTLLRRHTSKSKPTTLESSELEKASSTPGKLPKIPFIMESTMQNFNPKIRLSDQIFKKIVFTF